MGFLVTVRCERFTGTYVLKTASEAIAKSERHAEFGTVKIIDPHHQEWLPDQFQLMLAYWAARGPKGPDDFAAKIGFAPPPPSLI
jgi:hypothetical protein